MSNRVYEIRHTDNRGFSALVGLIAVIVLTRMWWNNLIADMFLAAYAPQSDGLSSATYVIIGFIANVIYGIGTVIVMAWSGLWYVVTDVLSGIRQYSQERRARTEVSDAVAQVATTDAVADTSDEPMENPIVKAMRDIDANVKTTYESVQGVSTKIEVLDARVTMIEEEMTQPKATPKRTRQP